MVELMSQPASRGPCYCVDLRRQLKPGDTFYCRACDEPRTTPTGLPPPVEANERTPMERARINVRELFTQVMANPLHRSLY